MLLGNDLRIHNKIFSPFSAVAVNAKLQYSVVEVHSPLEDVSKSKRNEKGRLGNALKEQKNLFLVVASDLVPTLEAKWGLKLVIKKTLLGSDLENCRLLVEVEFEAVLCFFKRTCGMPVVKHH